MKYNGIEPEQFPAEVKIAIRLLTSTLYSQKTVNASNMVTTTACTDFFKVDTAAYVVVNILLFPDTCRAVKKQQVTKDNCVIFCYL
jgi:hypothetical protein